MTNATKTLSIVLVSLVALTALVKWTSTPSSSKAFRSVIVAVDTVRVDKLVIERPAQDPDLTLQKNQSGWMVSEAGGDDDEYPADGGTVQQAIGQLNGLNVKAVVTRDPDNYTRYKADSTGTRVSLFDGNEQLASVIVGAPQFVSRTEFNSYVRPAGDDAVYAVDGFLSSTFNRNIEGWRDKQVWDLERDQITRIDFLFPADSSYSIKRAGENSWMSREDTLEQSEVRSVLNRLDALQVNDFVDSLSVSDFGAELYAIQLQLDNGMQKTVRLKPAGGDDDTMFLAVASGYPYVFTVYKSSWENSVLKPRGELLKELGN